MTQVRVLTLNCWGIWLLSSDRKERIAAISTHIAQGEYDLVLLQEVWCVQDFHTIRREAISSLPFSHFFHTGAIGSGTCVLSKYSLQDATFHEYSLNGNPQDILHGDWYAGKGLGVCCLKILDMHVRVFISHLHAEYLSTREAYLAHRVVQALEAALWIKLASAGADLVIFGGDFNSEPGDAPYNIIRSVSPLKDAWIEANGDAGGESCGAEKNSYTGSHSMLPGSCSFKPSELATMPKGQRIDFIMFKSGTGWKCEATSCSQPLPDKIPGRSISYSDHEAVYATLRVERDEKQQDKQDDINNTTKDNELEKKEVLNNALTIVSDRLAQSYRDQVFFSVVAILCVCVVSALSCSSDASCWVSTLAVSLSSIASAIYSLLAGVTARKEQNALKAARQSILVLMEKAE